MEFLSQVYTTRGRLNRLRYLKYQVIFTLLAAVIGAVLAFVCTLSAGGNSESFLVTVPTGIWSFVAGIGGVMLSVRRLHDLNKNGWFMFLTLVPLVNVIFALYIWLVPGTNGWNDYGADPLEELS